MESEQLLIARCEMVSRRIAVGTQDMAALLCDTLTALLIQDIEKSDGDSAAQPTRLLEQMLHEAKVHAASLLCHTT
jgi:hypothetical protein